MRYFTQLWPYIRPYRRRLVVSLVATGLYTALMLLPPLAIGYYVDNVIVPKNRSLLLPALAILVALPVMGSLIRFGAMMSILLAGRRLLADVRTTLYERVLALGMQFHGTSASGAVVGRIMSDVNMMQRLLTSNTVQILVDLVTFCFALTVAFILSWQQATILCCLLILYLFVYWRYSKRIAHSTKLYRGIYDEIGGRLQETVAGVRQVRIYNREEWENDQFLGRTNDSLQKMLNTRVSSISMNTACMMIAGFGSTLIITLNAYFILTGRMPLGHLLAFDAYVWMAIHPAIRLTMLAGELAETFVSVDRIGEVLDKPIDILSVPGAPDLKRGPGAVGFEDIVFSYGAGTPLYQGLSLRVPAGSTVALVGHTGCGKTTLTALLMRYWDIQSGSITIDGVDIRTVDLKSLRRRFGVVLQDSLIFDGTLAENIAYSQPSATRLDIEEAAKAAEIYEMAVALPDGFDTVIGTHGIKLSVGEKQRVSIARAILRDPAILIMDEATSSLDSESEALIQKSLARVLRGRTSLVIAHRLSTITKADMIVVMDKGRILETGTHAELLQRDDSPYRALYEEMLSGTSADATSEDAAGGAT
jgi:ABC-type multidrug transport system fused ATPase/permease subunit